MMLHDGNRKLCAVVFQICLNKTVPLCSWQYERVFNTTRVPGEETGEVTVKLSYGLLATGVRWFSRDSHDLSECQRHFHHLWSWRNSFSIMPH